MLRIAVEGKVNVRRFIEGIAIYNHHILGESI
jgi:hypothetical protein